MVSSELKDFFIFLKSSGIVKNQIEFAKSVGKSRQYISEAMNNTEKLTENVSQAIKLRFAKEWGDWEKLKSDTSFENVYPEESNESDKFTTVLLLPVSAQGGTLKDFMVSVKETDCEQIVSPIKGADFAMTVAGDSMAPEYPSGCQILIKKINEKAFIEWGKVYVLDTCNGSVIKRILPAEDNKMKCESINSRYPPFEVEMKDVFGVYRVLMMMSVK